MKLSFLFALACCFFFPSVSHAEKCTQEQAQKKMQAFQLYTTENLSGPNQRNVAFMAQEVAEVGTTLAEKKYDEACAEYERIAQKYKVNLKAYVARTIDPNKAAKNGCSMVTASTRATTMTQSLEAKLKAAAVDDSQRNSTFGAFIKDMNPIYLLLQTNPGAACDKMDAIQKKYEL